jgi:hypothetical protein
VLRLVLAIGLIAIGCSTPPASPRPTSIGGLNSTPVAISVVVNGSNAVVLAPVSRASVLEARLPPLPWSVQLRLPSGKVIGTLNVSADFPDGATFTTTDLSCGRVMVWVGTEPASGPAPPSQPAGAPGDCA